MFCVSNLWNTMREFHDYYGKLYKLFERGGEVGMEGYVFIIYVGFPCRFLVWGMKMRYF